MSVPRTMLSFNTGSGTFQVRAAAIIRRHGHILIHRMTLDTFWGLPGGRVEMGEPAESALLREIAEELGCGASAGPLSYVLENFFELDQRPFHELGFYFEVVLADGFPFAERRVCYRLSEDGKEYEFMWVRPDPAILAQYDFKPPQLIRLIAVPATVPTHLVHRG